MQRDAHRSDGQSVGDLNVVYGDTDSIMFTLSNVYNPHEASWREK